MLLFLKRCSYFFYLALSDVDVTSIDTSKPEENLLLESTKSSSSTVKDNCVISDQALIPNFASQVKSCSKTLDHAIDLADALSPGKYSFLDQRSFLYQN